MNLALFGPPGSGKGTQANFLVQHFGIPQVSTGDLFRAEIKAQTDVGRKAQTYMDRGDLVPDSITLQLVRRRLDAPDTERGVLFDGFPRTVAQATELDKMLQVMGRRMDRVIFVQVPTDVLVDRLAGRLTCPKCGRTYHPKLAPPQLDTVCDHDGTALIMREDDRPETARKRISVYLEQTLPVLAHYRQQHVVSDIAGTGSIEEVRERILRAIGVPSAAPAGMSTGGPAAGVRLAGEGPGGGIPPSEQGGASDTETPGQRRPPGIRPSDHGRSQGAGHRRRVRGR